LERGDAAARVVKSDEEAIDPATLPPLESLGPESDYTVFLRKGVPEALRLAALRKAWTSDPFIREFRSPAIEYGWDFTTPEFSLRAGDDVGKMLDRMFSPAPADSARPGAASPPAPEPPPAAAHEPLKLPQEQAPAAQPAAELPQSAGAAPASSGKQRRRHGGALPTPDDAG
jgi:hypothetical protein